jgi:prevent-host-death family protein
MKTMAVGEFKAKCLGVIASVNATGEPILLTKRGKPVARVVSPSDGGIASEISDSADSIFGCLRGMLKPGADVSGLVEPIIAKDEWDHLKGDFSLEPDQP